MPPACDEYYCQSVRFSTHWVAVSIKNLNYVLHRYCQYLINTSPVCCSAIFNFQSLLTVILLLICTCAYIRALAPSILDKNKSGGSYSAGSRPGCAKQAGLRGLKGVPHWLWCSRGLGRQNYFIVLQRTLLARHPVSSKADIWPLSSRGERKSPYVAICCVVMAFSILFAE
ncbi:UNVERIFIED_CONTAM: hypothetical protein FKN15_019907 [Acipenser sinensis]